MLIGIVGILSLLLRNSAPILRYWLWSIVVIRLCIPLRVHFPFDLGGESGTVARGLSETIVPVMNAVNTESVFSWFTNPSMLIHLSPAYDRIFFSAWFILAGALGLTLGLRAFFSYRILRKSTPVRREDLSEMVDELRRTLKIRRPVRLCYSNLDTDSGPSLFGILHPRILLPRSIAETWSAEEIRPILIHELIHVKRFDPLFNWIQGIVQIVYFFHPLVWLVNSRVRALREESCDDLTVLYLDNKSKRYSECLYNAIQESSRGPVWRMAEAGFAERKNSLARRIVRILDKQYEVRVKIGVKSAAGLLLIGLVGFTISCDTIVGVGEDSVYSAGVEALNKEVQTDQAQRLAASEKSRKIAVTVTPEEILVCGERVPLENLENKLSQHLKNSRDYSITVHILSGTPHERVDLVYQAAYKAGAKGISVMPPEE